VNNLEKYYKVQHLIRTGDHLGWKSSGIVGKLIRLKTGNTINHSSMAIRLNYEGLEKRRYDVGALNRGIEFHMLSRMLEKYNGKVWWYPLKNEYNELRPKIAMKAFEFIDTPYDYGNLFKNVLGRVSTNLAKLFCSEFYNLALWSVGIDTGWPVPGKAPTPADVHRMKIFKDKIQIL